MTVSEKQTFRKTFRIKLLIPTLLISNGMFHFLSAPLPPPYPSFPMDVGFPNSGTRIFLRKSRQNLDPLNKFFQRCQQKMNRSGFIF